MDSREALKSARRIVVKLGTGALTVETGRFNRAHFQALCGDLSQVAQGRELVVVSSGAVALGVERLGYPQRPKDIPGKQACAAVGQSRLVQAYEEALAQSGRSVAQFLLTHDDLQDRRRYLNAKHVMERLIGEGVVPIINENDTISVDELKFGDNDTLAGMVAALIGADLLVILSDVEGLFSADPRKDPSATMLEEIPSLTPEVMALAGSSTTGMGVGGMWTKLRAAERVTELGIPCLITSGKAVGRLPRVLAGERVGSLFHARPRSRSARGAWIAHVLRPKGTVKVDPGARLALVEGKRSLLPSGILAVGGSFSQGDPVDLLDEAGQLFARGLAAYDSNELRRIAGRQSSEIEGILGFKYLDEAIHRDDLAVLKGS
jgi:glutamate 5-kinase